MIFAILLQAVIGFAAIAQGGDSRIRMPRDVVIRSAAEWQALWNEHSSRPVPDVDFSSSIVAGVFLGSRPTTGYSVEITAVTASGREAVVEYRERTPPTGAITGQMLTSPFHLVRLPRDVGAVRFRKVEPGV